MNEELNVVETFISLKGEGLWTGKPMFFIRLGGCNLSCSFCDTDWKHSIPRKVSSLLRDVAESKMQHVVITGGEPLLQENVFNLIDELRRKGFKVHIETNGTLLLPVEVDWLAVSPKTLDCGCSTIFQANEVKFLWDPALGFNSTFIFQFVDKYRHELQYTLMYVMPIAKSVHEGNRSITDLKQENVKGAIDFCLKHPQFSFCLQIHKVLGIQ